MSLIIMLGFFVSLKRKGRHLSSPLFPELVFPVPFYPVMAFYHVCHSNFFLYLKVR